MTKNLPKTSELIKKYNLNAKKSLGQNFIFDSNLTDKIVNSAGNIENFEIFEIGPGPGALTCSILRKKPQKLIVIEKDTRFLPLLEEIGSFFEQKLQIINEDALKIDENSLVSGKKFKIIANLPYNVGTELIFKWLKNCQNIENMVLLLQKEVVERIVAPPKTKKYGRISVMINFLCETKRLFDVSPKSFSPPPKVTSTMVKITPREKPLMDVDITILSKICQAAFGQKRKMLRSSLKSLGIDHENLLKKCEINQKLRAEELNLYQFGALAHNYSQFC